MDESMVELCVVEVEFLGALVLTGSAMYTDGVLCGVLVDDCFLPRLPSNPPHLQSCAFFMNALYSSTMSLLIDVSSSLLILPSHRSCETFVNLCLISLASSG